MDQRYRTSGSSMSSIHSGSSFSNTAIIPQDAVSNAQTAEPAESQGLRATTIGSVVVRCGTIQLVIALLQSVDKIYIKVIELEPKITTLGADYEESMRMQREHDDLLRSIQNLPGPLDEFVEKADKLLASKRISSTVVNAMADTLNIIWQDILSLLQDRHLILQKSTQFHDKMSQCQKHFERLKVACVDTMLPIEVSTVQEILNKFKQLRIDMLTAVMAALKDGNELLVLLQEITQLESQNTRPEHIRRDALRAVHQVQQWLEALHDSRNSLEFAWQTRKTQLEQCLALALLARELQDLETNLHTQRNEVLSLFNLGDCERTANNFLHDYREWKHSAQLLRDRALRITRAKEKLQASGTFSGDEACARSYEVLGSCTDYLDLLDQREHWLQLSRDFFTKAQHTLEVLQKLELELSHMRVPSNTPESFAMYTKVAHDVRQFTEDPLRLGYALLDDVGRTAPETKGVRTIMEQLQQRKAHLESMCAVSNEDQQRVQHIIDEFMTKHNDLLNWLTSSGQMYLKQYVQLGRNVSESKQFLLQHHQLMQDLEIKGELINLLLESIKSHLEAMSAEQRYNVDSKAESLHKHWIELKDLVLKRVDYVSLLIEFYEHANQLSSELNQFHEELAKQPDEKKLELLHNNWSTIRQDYANLKGIGMRFINLKILDPYIDIQSSKAAVEEILNAFNKRQVDVTTTLESWTTHLAKQCEVEVILEKIMSDNEETANKTKRVDTQLYPIFSTKSNDAKQSHAAVHDKLQLVLKDIDQAQQEIQDRVHTTLKIETNDTESLQKIDKVVSNLRSLQAKLDGIKLDYKTLVESVLCYLENILNLRQHIDEYFSKQLFEEKIFIANGNEAIGKIIAEHEHFHETCLVKFRALITQSELLIDRVRILEPAGAKEIDTDRILMFLENLRTEFESMSSEKMSALKSLESLQQFRNDLNDILHSLDSVCQQLDEINAQNLNSLAAAKTTSLAFEYFERTVELLEKRIEKLSETSKQQLYITNTSSDNYVQEELQKLNEKWHNFKQQVRQKRQSLDQSVDYFQVLEKIDAECRELNYFYNSVSNKITFIRDEVEAANLINDIEKYVTTREGPLREKVNYVTKITNDSYKVTTLNNDITNILQSFTTLKSDISSVQERIKNEAREKSEEIAITKQETRQAYEQIQHERYETRHKDVHVEQVFKEIKYVLPHFTRPLKDIVTREGDRLCFECEITGNPEPHIEWFKDGISMQQNLDYKTTYDNGVCRLLIEETLNADSGAFSCRAANMLGVAETVAVLTVCENAAEVQMVPPRIERYLESGRAKEGGCFEFVCYVTGNPLPTVQWFKNDKCIDDWPDCHISYNNGEAKLRIDEVFLEDDAVYTCSATNPVGIEHCSARLLVEPLEPTEIPHFKMALSNAMARVGHKIKLEAIVSGKPRPDIFWLYNGKPFYPRDCKYENERVTLIIPQAYPNDAGIYTLIAKSLAGETTSSCNVLVKGRLPQEMSDSELTSDMEPIRPSVQLPLKDVSVFEGKPVRLDCVIVGQPEPEVIWYHNERPVKESPDVQLLFQGDRCSLVINEVYQGDTGHYKVVAINSAGEANSRCEVKVTPLNVVEPTISTQETQDTQPKIEKYLSDVLVAEGETIEMEILATGEQPLTAKWYLANRLLDEDERICFISQAAQGIFKLIIKNVNVDDKGVYTVKVINNSGEAKCFSHLIVKTVNTTDSQRVQPQVEVVEKTQSPEFKEVFCDKGARIGDVVKFECIIKGKPTPKVRWLFNDQPVHGHNFLVSTSGDRQVLTIQDVSTESVGKISCVAENEVGNASCTAFLSLHGNGLQFPATGTSELQKVTQEYNTGSSHVTLKKQTLTTTSTMQVNSFETNVPPSEVQHSSAHIERSIQQLEQHRPLLVESHQYQELHKSKDISVPDSSDIQIVDTSLALASPVRLRKQIAPRFTTPLTGKIVDQGCDISMEAIYDGFPSPVVAVQKNGEQLFDTDRLKITNKCNRITIDVKDVIVPDAGRYAVTVTNDMGKSTSTADLVVKKTIFPPVFGRRLQAQVVRKGEKIIMEVEVTGLPEPNVVWMKDEKPLSEAGLSQHRLLTQGNSHKLIIEKGEISDSGKYMIVATNAGGEAKSIADCAILEPSPERLQEVVKTIVYEQPTEIQAKDFTKAPFSYEITVPQVATASDLHGLSESKIITEHRCTTEATMRLEHKSSYLDLPELSERPKTPAEQPKSMDTTRYEFNEFNTSSKPVPPIVPPKPTPPVNSVPSVFQPSVPSFESYTKKTEFESTTNRSNNEIKIHSATFQPYAKIHEPLKIIPMKTESNLKEKENLEMYNLVPGSPPEICFIPKAAHKREPTEEKQLDMEISSTTTTIMPSQVMRSPSPKPSAAGVAMSKLWVPTAQFTSQESDTEQSYKSIPKPTLCSELHAPTLVKEAIKLVPGSPPEICFAPKTEDRRQSLVEAMEKTLEQNLIQGPSKVLPHSVPTLTPPSASPATTQKSTAYRPPPPTLPSKFNTTRNDYYESDYESDRYKYSGSESDDNSLRHNTHQSHTPIYSAQSPCPPSFKISGYAADTEDFHNINRMSDSYYEVISDTKHQLASPAPYVNGYDQPISREKQEIKSISSQATTGPITTSEYQTSSAKFSTISSPIARKTPAEFSDYSSEVEERFRSVSRNYESDTNIKGYRVVFPPTPTPTKFFGQANGQKSPIVVVTPSPMELEPTPAAPFFSRPKFEPIQKEKTRDFQQTKKSTHFHKHEEHQYQKQQQSQQQQYVFKPKPVVAKYFAATQNKETKPTVYYNAIAGMPLHTAKMATETTENFMQMESSNTCEQVTNMQRTKRIIHFESQSEKLGASSQHESLYPLSGRSTRAKLARVPTPTKFIPGKFKDGENRNEAHDIRIAQLWTPYGEKGGLRYRHVDAPKLDRRANSLPRSYERVLSPMEFDRGPEMPSKIHLNPELLRQQRAGSHCTSKTQSLDRNQHAYNQQQKHYQTSSSSTAENSQRRTTHSPRDQLVLKGGPPPQYGYIATQADYQGKQMSSTFLQKSHKFMQNITSDLKKTSYAKPISDNFRRDQRESEPPQVYRDEGRLCKYVSEVSTDLPHAAQHFEQAKNAPVFMTSLKNIAVMSGQTARFECIVQSQGQPTVIWTHNNQVLQDSVKHVVEYRNGICRLTLPQAFTDDAGTYACTATNALGSTTTAGQLLVQNSSRGLRY